MSDYFKKRMEEMGLSKKSSTSTSSDNEKKKKSSYFADRYHELGLDRDKSGKEVDSDYISSFMRDADSYFGSAESDYGMMKDHVTSESIYNKRKKTADDLSQRSFAIKQYLDKNRDKLDEKSYTELSKYLDDFGIKSAQVGYSFYSANRGYGRQYERDNVKNMPLEEIEARAKKDGRGTAYVDDDGSTVTWDTHYWLKNMESQIKGMDKETYKAYNALMEGENDIVRAENAMFALTDEENVVIPDEYKADLEHIISKYGIETEGHTNAYIRQQIDDLYKHLISGGADYISANDEHLAVLEKGGYDWDDIAYYHKYMADKEEAAKLKQDYATAATDHPVLSTVGSIVQAPLQIFDFLENIADQKRDEDGDRPANIYNDTSVIFANTVTGTVAQNIDNSIDSDVLSWVASTAYSGVTSAAQSAVTAATASALFGAEAGKVVTLGILGSQAAASGYHTAIQNGSTPEQALMTGVANGVAEALFEKLPLDNLLKVGKGLDVSSVKNLLLSAAKGTVLQGLAESGEELGTTLTNALTDAIINGDHSSYNTAVERYMMDGHSEASARKLATKDFVNEVMQSVVGGFIGGTSTGAVATGGNVMMGLPAAIRNSPTSQGNIILENKGYADLKALAESMSAEASGIKSLDRAVAKAETKTTARNVGKLSAQVESVRTQQNLADVQKALTEEGMSESRAKKVAKTVVKIAEKKASGMELTQEEYDTVTRDKATYAAYSSLISDPDSSVNSRNDRIANARVGITKNEDGTVSYSDSLISRITDAVVHEAAYENIGSQNRFRANMGVSEDGSETEDADFVPMTAEEAATFKGKTTVYDVETDSHKAVEITGIASIKDGEMILKLDNGETANASDVRFASEGEALVYSTVLDMGVNAGTAEALVGAFKGSNVSAGKYALGIKDAYSFGKMNIPLSQLSRNSFAHSLTKGQQGLAYKLGKSDAKAETKARQAAIDEKVASVKGKAKAKVGSVIIEDSVTTTESGEIDESVLNAMQKASLEGVKALAQLSPINFHVFASKKVDGKFVATINGEEIEGSPNGVYFAGTNDIWIDINAGDMGEGTMLWTAAHEISHYIRERSPAKWKAMADFAIGELSKKQGVSVHDLLENQKAKVMARADADTKTDSQITDEAYEELVSDALTGMLTDGSVVEALANLKQQDKGLWQTIKDAIADLLKRWGEILGVYEGKSHDTAEARALEGMDKAYKKLQKMYAEAFAEANAVEEAIGDTLGVRNLEDFAEAKTTDGEKLFQYRAMEADEAIYKDMLRKWGGMSNAQINNLFTTIDKAMDIIKDNLEVLDYAWEADIDDRAFAPVKPNSDKLYKVSLDFSTLCRKRILQQTIITQLQAALEKPLTREEGIAIRDALMALQEEGRKIEVACALCYVESARMKSPKQIEKFLKNREAVLKEFFASKDGGSMKAKVAQAEADARAKLGVGDKALKDMPKKTADAIRKAKKDAKSSYVPTEAEQKSIEAAMQMSVSDFTSPEGLESLAKNHPDIFDAYTSYVRNATKSKGIENDTWWRAGDSERIGDVLIANMNRENGLRSQSWSDFQVIHILDYIAATIELSTRNAKEQAYTKVPDYVDLMGQTGVMINMSLIPEREFDGTLKYDEVEGIAYKKALELRDKYPDTAGTICIGIDNKQIQMLLSDINIDYVIPYHKSGMAASIRKLMHIPSWEEFEKYQNETELSDAEAKKNAEKYGVKLLDKSDENYHKHTSFSEWFDLETARKIAKQENKYPSDAKKREAYGVMYGGYMAMQAAADNYIKLCAERGLAPKFSHEKADFTVEDNYWKLLIDRKMVNNKTGEIIEQQTIKPIFEEGEILRILNDEIERYPGVKEDQDYATRVVAESFLSGKVRSGMSAEAIAKAVKKPVDNVTKVNIMASAEKLSARNQVRSTASFSQEFIDKTLMGFGIEKIGDFVHVQKQVLSTLLNEGFFENLKTRSRSDVNKGSGMVIETNKSGIDETFDLQNYARLGIPKKIIKLATIRMLPEIIREGKLVKDNAPNQYGDGKNKKFAYINYECELEGKHITLQLDIKKSPQKNKFWVHKVTAIENVSDSPASTNNGTEAGQITADTGDIITQPSDSVKKKFSERNKAYADTVSRAVERFGTTTDFAEAGFILPSGELLRLTGDNHRGERQYDHRAIGIAYGVDVDLNTNRGYNRESNKHLDDFVENGGIRFDGGYLEFNDDAMMQLSTTTPLTREQEQTIRDFIKWQKQREEAYDPSDDPLSLYRGALGLRIDFGNTSSVAVGADRNKLGIKHLSYEGGQVNADRIIADIRHYYKTGETRQASSVAQFHYSTRNTDSNRSLLANALETTVQNEVEANKLREYKEKIALIDAEQQKLAEINAQIREISFSKGKRDTAKLKSLRFDAAQTANRINTFDRQLLNLESTKVLKRVLEREKGLARKRQKQKNAEVLKDYRDRYEAKLREQRQQSAESRKKAADRRKASAIKEKIKNFKAKLESSLLSPTDRVYVPVNLINAMIDVCGLIDTDTELYKADGSVNKAQEKRNTTKERLQALKDEYEALKDNTDPTYSGEYDEVIYKYLAKLLNDFGNKSLADMTLEELTSMYEILKSIDGTLKDARKLIGRADAKTIYEAADSIVAEQARITKKRKKGKRNKVQRAKDSVIDLSLSPVRNVERMSGYNSDSELVRLFHDFEKGVRRKNMFVMQAYKAFEALTTGKNSKAYDDAIYKEFGGKKYVDVNGRKFGISKMQMMQTILSYEREVANKMTHIEGSGFSFADMDMLRKGKLRDAVSEEYSHRIPNAISMVESFRDALAGDKWAQEYMETARKFFNGTAKDAINETYLTLKHRILARDKSYIPFEVDKNFVVREISAQNDIQQTINSYGMLQETKKGASQPLIITGLNNILDRHIDQVGNVQGLAIPIRNFNKVWNVRAVESDFGDPSVQAAIQRNWGLGGTKHITQTVQDLQGARVNTQSDIYRKFKSGYIGATFALNLSVVTKQIGSLYSASSMLRWRDPIRSFFNLVGTMFNHKKIAAEVDKYTATAWMRRQGLSDAELHTLVTESKKPGLLKLFSKINPAKLITAMDSAVALSLWKYAKQDTAKRTGLKGEELLKATAEFYDSVIENTQSMTDVLHRPEIQKRSDVVSEAFGMFKTDLYQMAGQLQVTLGRYSANKTKENGKALGRTVYAVLGSAIWGSLMTTLFALLRYKVNPYRDDEDKDLEAESWIERQLYGLGGDVVGYFLPLFGGELVGIVENIRYGESEEIVDSLALTAINDLYESMVTVGAAVKDGEMPSAEQYKKLVVKALTAFGVPANNAVRFADAIRLHAKDFANGEFLSFEAGAKRTAAEHMHGIIEDLTAGKDVRKRFDKAFADKGASALKTALGNMYKDGEVDEATAKRILDEYFDIDADDIHWTLDKWDYTAENGSDEDYSRYDDFLTAVETGSGLKNTIKVYLDNGVSEDTLASQITRHFKPIYKAMSTSERARLKGYLLNAYELLGKKRSDKSKDIDKWLKDD